MFTAQLWRARTPSSTSRSRSAAGTNLATVRDSDLRARLTPNYKAGCKRLIVSDLFYPAIQRDNAELVATTIDRIEADEIRDIGRLAP